MLEIKGGNVTAMVSDMGRAIRFYTESLGFQLRTRYGDEWAEVETQGLIVGLHPAGPHAPAGREGSLSIGLEVQDLERAMAELQGRGVEFAPSAVKEDEGVRLAFFHDPDGTPLYLCQVRAHTPSS